MSKLFIQADLEKPNHTCNKENNCKWKQSFKPPETVGRLTRDCIFKNKKASDLECASDEVIQYKLFY